MMSSGEETMIRFGNDSPMPRLVLLVLLGFTAGTSIPSGLFMMFQSWLGPDAVAVPPEASLPSWLLEDSPFDTYLVPGLILSLVVGGTHLWAFMLTLRRSRRAHFVTAVAGYAILMWIFVQMVFIPFSFLQALYFAVGMAELGFLLLALGLVRGRSPSTPGNLALASGNSAMHNGDRTTARNEP